jgi:tRNA (guanosine-2'-O-)-methyltransferase
MSGGGPRYEPLERAPAPAEFLLPQRLERIEQVLSQRTRTLTVVLDRLEDTFNMAAVLRTCEAFGLQDVHVIRNPDAPFKPNGTVTQGCDKWLDLHLYRDFKTCAQALKARGYRVLASALREGATSLYELAFDAKLALVFGNERFGVSDEVLSHCDGTFVIPMRGFVQSMNISAAASATLSYAVGWRLQHLGKTGDLSEAERSALREQFQLRSVRQRGRIYRNR